MELKVYLSYGIFLPITVWQEVFDNGIRLDRNNSIIQVWKDWGTKWEKELKQVNTSSG